MQLSLVYLSGNTTGGWVTYTAHLVRGMPPGVECSLYKVTKKTERNTRPFGYGMEYQNVSLPHLLQLTQDGPVVVVALQKNYRAAAVALAQAGAWMVVHDPAEFVHLKEVRTDRMVVIRRAVQRVLVGSRLVVHPYARGYRPGTQASGEHNACSIARIDFDKNTTMILDANRLLPPDRRVRVHGFENRIYTRFKVCPNYPEWEQSKCAYPREFRAASAICHRHTYSVDMSLIKGDGGGTQYSFMEAMDAGSVNVIHSGWVLPGDEMQPGVNCLAAGTPSELADVLGRDLAPEERQLLVCAGNRVLANHAAGAVAQEFIDVVGR